MAGRQAIPTFAPDPKGMGTRESSGRVLNAIAERVPWLLGGSADLSPSTKTRLTFAGAGDLQPGTPGGRNLHFGVREHASAAIANGMAVTKLRPFWSGFLIFSDYARGAMRLSALMEIPVIHVFTHDSIGVGEDGPTHQPVEQLASLRAMPGLLVFRPADANEVAETWRVVMRLRHEPAAIVLSRQALPTFDRSELGAAAGVARGAYVLADAPGGRPDVILLATGSEVALAVGAREELAAEGIARARRQHAVLGAVRAPARRVPRRRAAAGRARAGRDRAGVEARLGALGRRPRGGRRHGHVRRLGAAASSCWASSASHPTG